MKVLLFFVLIFIFLFRTNGRKGNLDENDFREYYFNFSESTILKVS